MPEEHKLTPLLPDEAITLAVARSVYDEAGGGAAGAVAARRYMDAELRALSPWPSDQVYEAAAGRFTEAGQDRIGDLLREVAAAGERLEEAEKAWQSRYNDRGPLPAEQMAAALRRDGDFVSWDPVGPYAGIDGAQYWPGSMNLDYHVEPVVLVEGRGTAEVITGWASINDMQDWIATRGTGGSRELTPPPVPSGTRAWLEDTVLAHIVNRPFDAAETLRTLDRDTMTTDVRWEVYGAVLRLSGVDIRYYTPEAIIADAKANLADVPPDGLARYGGADAPFIRAYVNRLAETPAGGEDFRSAVRTLRHEDLQAKRRMAVMDTPSQRQRQAPERSGAPVVETPETCPELSPGHVSGPQTGPVPGR